MNQNISQKAVNFKLTFLNLPIHLKITIPKWKTCGKSSTGGAWISPLQVNTQNTLIRKKSVQNKLNFIMHFSISTGCQILQKLYTGYYVTSHAKPQSDCKLFSVYQYGNWDKTPFKINNWSLHRDVIKEFPKRRKHGEA